MFHQDQISKFSYLQKLDLFSDKNLSSLLGSLLTKNMKVQYVGDIDYKIMGFSHKYHVDVIDNVKIKL